uniref:UDP-glucuronosyltransferase n=1 Tax=Panagrellus redivivus TaxID=6233 RepID=A0A7E5A0J2_PANRE
MRWSAFTFVLIIGLCQICTAKNVLFFIPALADSVVIQAGRLADLLVDDGHNVTFFIPEMTTTSKNNGTKKANVIRMGDFAETFSLGMKQYTNVLDPHAATLYKRFKMGDYCIDFCKQLIVRRKELDFLKAYKFDAIVSNVLEMCDLGIARYLGIDTHIWTVTGPMHETTLYNLGLPSPPSYLPVLEDATGGSEMTFMERAQNMYLWFTATVLHKYITFWHNYNFRYYIDPNFPGVDELAADSAITFINTDEFIDYPRPILHKTIYIGGAGLKKPQPLTEEFLEILSKGKDGTVLVSFGSNCNTLAIPFENKMEMIRAFSSFVNYHFLMKVSHGDNATINFGKQFNNIDFTYWTPQTDLLGHPALKAFITHAGINSVIEAATRGVPIITVPLFFDQFRNAKMAEHRGFGLVIKKEEFGEAAFTHALQEILYQPKYTLAAKRISKLIRTKPNPADETFLKWSNFVLENGKLPELTPVGSKMHFITYYNLDVIAVLLLIIITTIWSASFVFHRLNAVTTTKSKNE